MNKELPKVYAVPIDKKLENNKDIFLSREEEVRGESIDISEINKIFNSKTHVYKTRVKITTRQETKEVDAIGLNGENILTLSGEKIPVSEIIEIKKV